MTCDVSKLNVLATANGFTLWHYTTPDVSIEETYFSEAAEMLCVGDIIFAVMGCYAADKKSWLAVANYADILLVTAITPDTVTVAAVPRRKISNDLKLW